MKVCPSRGIALALYCIFSMCCTTTGHTEGQSAALQTYVPANAQSVEYQSAAVRFTIAEEYPARVFIRDVRHHFEALAWHERDALITNPGVKYSDYDDGWSVHLEGETRVHSWATNWESDDGEYIVCYIRYRGNVESSGRGRQTAEVVQMYFSAEQAAMMRPKQ